MKPRFENDFAVRRLQTLPRFFNGQAATAEQFLKEVATGVDAIAFIGHAVLHTDTHPEWGSTGLRFSPKSIVKQMSPEQPTGPGGLVFTIIVPKITTKARIIFIAACETTDIFKSLWDIDESTDNRSLIVPVGGETDLFLSAQTWRVMADSLSRGDTASVAVAAGNAYLAQSGQTLRFQVIGGQNVRVTLRSC